MGKGKSRRKHRCPLPSFGWDERKIEESHRISDIIAKREETDFQLPSGFDPTLQDGEEETISRRLWALEQDLTARGFSFLPDEGLPLKVRYEYAQHVALITEGLRMPGEYALMINGCCAWCPDCFQSPWCKIKEIVEKEAEEELSEIDPFSDECA